MREDISLVLVEVGASGMDENIDKVEKVFSEIFKRECSIVRVREIFAALMEEYGADRKHGYTMSKSNTMYALGVSRPTLDRMMIDGTSPSYFRTSKGKKSSIRFHIISVAEFLAGHV